MIKEVISGIYKITNKVNNKSYIGSSNNIKRRWKQHINLLNKGEHHSIKLQRAWNKYGQDNFKFEILEECDVEKLLYLEQFYIDKYKAYFEGYNSKEKTRDIYTEEDYKKDSEIENNINIFLETAIKFKDIGVVFFDKKTWNNISNKKENIKNFPEEFLIYRDILVFTNKYFSKYENIEVVIKNNRKENFTDFVYFSDNNDYMSFDIWLKNEGIIVECKIYVKDRTIIIENAVDSDGYDFIFSNKKIKRDSYINELITYIYYPNGKRERLTDEYFKKIIILIYNNNIAHVSRYKYIYGECDGFMENFKEYVLKNKLSYFIQNGKYKNEFKEINCNNKKYKELFLKEL